MEYPDLFVGVDPGQSGGIAAIGLNFVEAFSMPATERDVYDLIAEYAPNVQHCFIESVHSFPGQGVASSFTFGKGYGFLRGVLVALKIPFTDVSPQKWKKAMGLHYAATDAKKDKKNGSKQLCQ